MTAPVSPQVQVPPGLFCVTTYGSIRQETAQCMMEMRSFNEANGLKNVKYLMLPGTLVEKARNEAVRIMLREKLGYIFMADGDMSWQSDAMMTLLQTAYAQMPYADVVGGLCPLRGELALPTVDSGTGTWESWFPYSGVPEVMRTGAAFLLAKRHCFERLKDPWFRMRVPARPVDFMAEVDNLCRMKFNGDNPFRGLPDQPWEKLEKIASEDPAAVQENFIPTEVGEDSGFCDRARMAGLRIFVNTNVQCGHVDTVVRTMADHKRAMDNSAQQERYVVGLLA